MTIFPVEEFRANNAPLRQEMGFQELAASVPLLNTLWVTQKLAQQRSRPFAGIEPSLACVRSHARSQPKQTDQKPPASNYECGHKDLTTNNREVTK